LCGANSFIPRGSFGNRSHNRNSNNNNNVYGANVSGNDGLNKYGAKVNVNLVNKNGAIIGFHYLHVNNNIYN
jgi:hypothetical protein